MLLHNAFLINSSSSAISLANSIAFPERNITYGHFLEQMKSEFNMNLSESLFSELKKNKLSKSEFFDNITLLMEKSNEKAIEKANELNDTERVAILQKNLKTRIDTFQKEGKEIKLLLEEAKNEINKVICH
jgi:predicted choloylglycine hydrolase